MLRSGSAAPLCSNCSRRYATYAALGLHEEHGPLRWMLRLQNAILSPPVGSRKFSVQSAFKCFHHDRRYRGLRKKPVVTLTCASWGSVENIISGVWKGSLPFCSGISGIVTTPEAAESFWLECCGHLNTGESKKTSQKALFYVRGSTCYRCPAKSKYKGVYGLVCLLTLCDQDKKQKWEEGMVCLFLS